MVGDHPAIMTLERLISRLALGSMVSIQEGFKMAENPVQLDKLQKDYIAEVEKWINAIRAEEALAAVNHTVAEVDKWEGAHFNEDKIRNRVKTAKKIYEDALRQQFYGF